MAMTEKDFLTQMATMNQSCADMCRRFIIDNPDSEYEDYAEDCLEDCAGDAALLKLWIEVYPGDEGAASASARKPARDGVVYWSAPIPA